MKIELEAAAVGRGLAAEISPLTLTADAGEVAVLAVEGDDRAMHVSLLLGGRLRADAGRVLVDGSASTRELRRRTALVDTPFVAEPTDDLPLRLIVAEELLFAALPAGRAPVARFLAQRGLQTYASQPFRALPTAHRIRLLCDLALARAGVDALVVTSPERHGGDPAAWFPALATIASTRATVIVVTDLPTARQLQALGARDAESQLIASTESLLAS
jgi:uroporphyrinogen-III synthase